MLELQKYSKEDVLKKTLNYFKGDELATEVWINKYCLKDSQGNLYEQSPDDMHRRLSKPFADIENIYEDTYHDDLSEYGKKRNKLTEERIFDYFKDFKYISPQGSVMNILANPFMIGSLSNCVVLPKIYDSYGGITYTDQQLAQLFKRRCGVGIDISTIRPNNASVTNAAGSSTGAISYMERFSNTTREVGQSGRRGALMISIDVRHPDIEDFIKIKRDGKKVTGANISIRLTDDFMKSVENDEKYILRWPVDSTINEAKYTKTVDAKYIWNEIIKSAHSSAEPGLIFDDRQHWYSTSSIYPNWKNISTNPCSEIAMNNDSCRLMIVNYYNFVINPFTKNAHFDFDKLYEVSYEAQRLMDDLVDLELINVKNILEKIKTDPEPDFIKAIEIKTWEDLYKNGKDGRRTGLGFTALADTLAALGLKYDSDDAIKMVDKISQYKMMGEFDSSIDMAIQRGKFSDFNSEYENQSHFINMLENEFPNIYKRMMKYGRRNISISTTAPTGSLSILTQSSSGIEPVFTIAYKRRKKINPQDKNDKIDFVDEMGDLWTEFDVYHPKMKQWIEINNITDKGIIEKNHPYVGSTASEIDWINRIKMQSIIQKYVTHSISSTINLPSDVSLEKVSEIYFEAWKQKLKGITVYRDGSRSGVLISNEKEKEKIEALKDNHAPKRPKRLKGDIIRFQNDSEKWIAVVGLLDGRPYEIFTGKLVNGLSTLSLNIKECEIVKNKIDIDGNKVSSYDIEYFDISGEKKIHRGLNSSFNPEFWNYAKLISGILRHGMPLLKIYELTNSLDLNDSHLNTWKMGILRVIKKYIKDGEKIKGLCQECGSEHLEFKEGCLICMSCGTSKCS